MVILKFRNREEHEDLLMKVKRMKKFTQELEDCLEEAFDEEVEYRNAYYRKEDEEDMHPRGSRYGYRKGSYRM
jgi:hypothetical protein